MIPRHQPPFGVGLVVRSILARSSWLDVESLEQAYAQTFGVPHAILLPSGRAGICWALRATVSPNALVVTPAYTCQVVHEAVVRSGGKMYLVDASETSFLMDDAALESLPAEAHALVLCELYGYTYDLSRMSRLIQPPPRIRVVDMAMTVPHTNLLRRLENRDFAVLSFGFGKCMYAGWGAMGFTFDEALAAQVRALRNTSVRRDGVSLFIKRSLSVLLRTLAHRRLLYGVSRKAKQWLERWAPSRGDAGRRLPPQWHDGNSLPDEWRLPSTSLDRNLAFQNLQYAETFSSSRKALERRYREAFDGSSAILCPGPAPHPVSHYTIRVRADIRDAVRACLWAHAIDAGTLFGFPSYLPIDRFPRSRRIAAEVLNLPLGPTVRPEEVDRIARCVIRCVARFAGRKPSAGVCESTRRDPYRLFDREARSKHVQL